MASRFLTTQIVYFQKSLSMKKKLIPTESVNYTYSTRIKGVELPDQCVTKLLNNVVLMI